MTDVRVTARAGAPPLALGLAEKVRRGAEDPALRRTIASLRGRFALRSAKDPQTATIRFDKGRVEVTGGADPDAEVVVTADLATLGKPGAPKPQVAGALRHPLLAWRVAKVLDAKPAGWREAADDFWRRAADHPLRPAALRVVCADDGSDVVLGGDGSDRKRLFEVHGPSTALVALFNGDAHPAEALFGGEMRILGDQATLMRFIGLGQALMMGEYRRDH